MKTTNLFSGIGRLALAAAFVLPLTGCDTDSLLDVEDPDVTRPEALFDPTNLPALRATVIGDFGVAYAGSGSTTTNIGLVHTSGLMSDELWHSGTFGQNREFDKRGIGETNSFLASTAHNLYRALNISQLGLESYAQNQPNAPERAELANLRAYVFTFLGENFCNAVPVSTVTANGDFEYGAPETNQQLFTRALEAFDQATQFANAAGTGAAAVRQQNLARIGKARVLMDLNRYAEAAALVASVPTNFVYQIEHSANTTRQNNGLWGNNFGRREIALASQEGGVGIQFRQGTAPAASTIVNADPRLPWSFANGAADTRSIHYFQQKYPTQAANTNVASGVEARLIEAEAVLNRGQSAAYLPILNTLRASVGLGNLTDPGTPAARVDQFFTERAFWLFGTANRLSDLRRLVRQYNRPVNSVFPNGAYIRPGINGPRTEAEYDNMVAFPIPFDELNNDAFQAAADQCDPTVA